MRDDTNIMMDHIDEVPENDRNRRRMHRCLKNTLLNRRYLYAHKKMIFSFLVLLIVAVAVIISYSKEGGDSLPSGDSSSEITEIQTQDEESRDIAKIVVDISGAVKNPGVIFLDEGSRIYEAIEKAGGLADGADLTYINQAEIISDGEKIHVPKRNIDEDGREAEYTELPLNNDKININTADLVKLQEINGVGPSTAEKIINYRQKEHFRKIEDIKNVDGIGEKTFEKLKDHICV